MKAMTLLGLLILSANSFATDCKESVQEQVNQNTSYDYDVTLTELADSNYYAGASDIYDSGNYAEDKSELAVFEADSGAMGCYGVEYVTFNKKTCELYSIGGGYCE